MSLSLDQLALDRSATIISLTGPPSLSQRLMEMGLIEGEEVVVLRRAPFGDPIEIRIRGYELSLRTSEAATIHVKVDQEPR